MNLTLFQSKSNLCVTTALLGAAMLGLPFTGAADTFLIPNTTADAFLANGPSGNLATNNYGGAGTLAIASSSSPKGEFDSVIKFNTAGAISQFNTTYGAGNWLISGLTLSLASNTGTNGAIPGNGIFNTVSGGAFGIDWLSNDSWLEGSGVPQTPATNGVNFNSIATLLAGNSALGTFTYTPPGNNAYANYNLPLNASLVADAAAGGDVSLYFFAADNQVSYLFNARTFGSGRPELTLTAAPVPEPATISLVAIALGGVLLRGLRRKA